mmetsp:Transcript_31863/g.62186  ORF Transcript_31863/g.62186 Transcript_31863/m.62186 type:complete len:226 (-) Transcript_31863:496-1173(-)
MPVTGGSGSEQASEAADIMLEHELRWCAGKMNASLLERSRYRRLASRFCWRRHSRRSSSVSKSVDLRRRLCSEGSRAASAFWSNSPSTAPRSELRRRLRRCANRFWILRRSCRISSESRLGDTFFWLSFSAPSIWGHESLRFTCWVLRVPCGSMTACGKAKEGTEKKDGTWWEKGKAAPGGPPPPCIALANSLCWPVMRNANSVLGSIILPMTGMSMIGYPPDPI